MTTTLAEEEERADQVSKNTKCSILFTTILKLLFSVLFTVGTCYQHFDNEDPSMCKKCELEMSGTWSCTSYDEIRECMRPYKFGPLIGGAIVFCLSIIIEMFWVNYILYFKPSTTVNHIMCGVYAIGSLVIMVAAILEIEMDKNFLGYYNYNAKFWDAGLWIFGGILCLISQLYWAWVLKSCNVLVTVTYIPAIAATVLWIIARGIMGTDYLFPEPQGLKWGPTLQEDLMISASVLYIIHALFWFYVVYGTVSSLSKLKSQAQAQAQLEEGLKIMK